LDLKAINKCLPVVLVSGRCTVPGVVVLPLLCCGKKGKFVTYFLPCRRGRGRIEIFAELVFKANSGSFSSIEVHENETLRGYVRVDSEERESVRKGRK
jgi:hypothetical protein